MIQQEYFVVKKTIPMHIESGVDLVIFGVYKSFIKLFDIKKTGISCVLCLVFYMLNEGCIESMEFIGLAVNIFACVYRFSVQNR